MPGSKRSLASVAVAALLIGSGCGGGQDSPSSKTTSAREQAEASQGPSAAAVEVGQRKKSEKPGAKATPGSTRKKKAKSGEGKPGPDDRGRNQGSDQPAGVPARVEEAIEGDEKVLRQRFRNRSEGLPPVVEEVLEEAGSG
ncbi:MAG TPA: hypothetical protein VNC16_12500 [Solirubrobacterales bacterium]|jgi:hypothetical protein|nr:hypothetical protein [Solirubrobacterales bacterium]